MEIQNKLLSTNDFNLQTLVEIKQLKHQSFLCISVGERYALYQRFYGLYTKIKTIETTGKKYKIAFFLKDALTADFYEQKTKHLVILDYFYALFKSLIKCVDIVVTNQQYVALIADSLQKPVFLIKDNYAKEHNLIIESFEKNKSIHQLPINFNVEKNIKEFLQNEKLQSNISEDEFLSANPVSEANIVLDSFIPKTRKNVVKIAFITDENYAMMTAVAIQSAIENKKEKSVYEINIVCHNLSVKTKQKLAMLEETNVLINIINVDDAKKFKEIKQTRHITTTALIIFDLPEIFSDFDKILYIDGDVFIQGDLSNLYNTDITENYAAVVKDAYFLLPDIHEKKSLCTNENYFNGGVLLMNLAKMRSDGVSKKMLEWRKNNNSYFMNQDALNAVLSKNVKEMNCWHNFLSFYPNIFSREFLEKFYNVKMPKNSLVSYKKALILHYPGKTKPYMADMGWLTEEFFKYLQKTKFKDYLFSK